MNARDRAALAALLARDPEIDRRHREADAAHAAALERAWRTPGWGGRVRDVFLGIDADGAGEWDHVTRDYSPDLTLTGVLIRNCELRGVPATRTPPPVSPAPVRGRLRTARGSGNDRADDP